jgi:hypothetical protein
MDSEYSLDEISHSTALRAAMAAMAVVLRSMGILDYGNRTMH